MRKASIAAAVVLGLLTTVAPASAAPVIIGTFSWEPDFGLGLGPTFTFENQSGAALAHLSVDLDTDLGIQSFNFLGVACSDTDGDGVDECVSTPTLENGVSSQIVDDLSALTISAAFIRSTERPLFLVGVDDLPLFDAAGQAIGLDGLSLISARVAYESDPPPPPPPPAPVPEPGTLLLLAVGVSSALAHRRQRLGAR